MQVEARAKINWTLDILGQRGDGYHLMDMLMQPVTLSDTLTLEEAADISLTVEGGSGIPAGPDNLVCRAAEALRRAAGCTRGAAIRLIKRIPSGAGLGGGSADAAAVLHGLNRLWNLNLDEPELERIGLTLGADIPFCLRGGLARVGGIGEEITTLPGAPELPLVIIQPCEGLSTRDIFRAYHAAEAIRRPDNDAAFAALCRNDLALLRSGMGNVLQGVSEAARPAIREAIDALERHGAACAAMSGSGSAVFGVFETAQAATRAADALSRRWEKTYTAQSCGLSVLMDESIHP